MEWQTPVRGAIQRRKATWLWRVFLAKREDLQRGMEGWSLEQRCVDYPWWSLSRNFLSKGLNQPQSNDTDCACFWTFNDWLSNILNSFNTNGGRGHWQRSTWGAHQRTTSWLKGACSGAEKAAGPTSRTWESRKCWDRGHQQEVPWVDWTPQSESSLNMLHSLQRSSREADFLPRSWNTFRISWLENIHLENSQRDSNSRTTGQRFSKTARSVS